ncbi:MAG: DNA-directed RNA polymerase subunit L [Methanobrevibacter sp.]|jgi:DNA-directed RNA polymerase subunit L|nr:DNA-directed RNA polymerase subunit L [Candidatus Methanoflexus mossambicus]
MEDIEILKTNKTELEFVASGETHTFCNVLRHYLMEDPNVDYAVYGIDHPIIGKPIFTIKTKKRNSPKTALLKALDKIKENTNEFKTLVEDIS